MDKYIRGKLLGKGSFGSAILVTNKLDGKNYVIKEIDISRMPKVEREAAEQEARLLQALNHPNIVRCIECFTHQSKLCIVMDWCSEGDLYGILQKRRGAPLPEETIMDWFVQMCLGLKHVHDRKILHRDIKTQNVFMSSGGLLKLGDFGVSKILNSTWQLAATAVGTPYYLSPEICQNKRYNQKSDIWSLGCVLYELAAGRHAFEAPNMRALIQKIIRGSYLPVPSTRSRELRELVDRMLVVDVTKRPTVNDILATPIMKARITKFLSSTLQAHEFSHTVIHGKPKPGNLVVQHALPAPAFPSAAPGGAPAPAAAAVPAPAAAAAAARPAAPAALQPRAAGMAAGAGLAGRAPAAAAAAPFAGRPAPGAAAAGGAAARPGSAGVAAAAAAAAAQQQRAMDAAVAARQKAAQAQREREEAAAVAAAAAARRQQALQQQQQQQQQQAEAQRRQQALQLQQQDAQRRQQAAQQQRELAAVAAAREVERLKLEEQRKKVEAERLRLEADRRKAEASRIEAERKARLQDEAARRCAADEERKKRELEARKKKAEEEAKKRDDERAAREREREEMRAKMAQQKREYIDKQAAAARTKQPAPQPGVQVYDAPAARQRKQWSPVNVPERPADAAADEEAQRGGAGAGRWSKPGPNDPLTAEQRRAVWEEQRAAAERNRRAAAEADRAAGGLAGFLGVPADGPGYAAPQAGPSDRAAVARGKEAVLSPEQRRQMFMEQQAEAARNRAAAKADGPSQPPQRSSTPPSAAAAAGRAGAATMEDPYERKKARLEAERAKREAEILEFQRRHWQEMKAAAARNRANIISEVREGGAGAAAGPSAAAAGRPPSSQASAAAAQQQPAAAGGQGGSSKEEENDDLEFAAMVKDMQDILSGSGAGPDGGAAGGAGDDDDDDVAGGDKETVHALEGRFMLAGQEVPLPVRSSDSLALKVEALRCYLEQQLGTDAFLRVYRRLESLSMDDDEAEVSKEFLAVLGPQKLPYLQLIHQLIVCEENLNSSA